MDSLPLFPRHLHVYFCQQTVRSERVLVTDVQDTWVATLCLHHRRVREEFLLGLCSMWLCMATPDPCHGHPWHVRGTVT